MSQFPPPPPPPPPLPPPGDPVWEIVREPPADMTPPRDPLASLSHDHQKFVLALLEHGAIKRAAEAVGYAGAYGYSLVKRPEIQTAIRAMRDIEIAAHAMDVMEARGRLAEISRDTHAKDADRIRATEIILKSLGALGPDVWVDGREQSVTYVVGAGTPAAVLDAADILRRVASGTAVPPGEAAAALEGLLAPAIAKEET